MNEVQTKKSPSLETIQAKSDNIVVRLNELFSSLDYLTNGGKPGAECGDKASLKDSPHIQQIGDTLSRAQSIMGSCENLLAKIRYG